MVDGLVDEQKRAVAQVGETTLAGFVAEQRTALARLSGAAGGDGGDGGDGSAAERLEELDEIRMMLGAWVDPAEKAASGDGGDNGGERETADA